MFNPSNLRVGDVCEIIADLDGYMPHTVGQECTIIGGLEWRLICMPKVQPPFARVKLFEIRLAHDHPSGGAYARPEELRRKKPPAARWEDCAWQPQRELA